MRRLAITSVLSVIVTALCIGVAAGQGTDNNTPMTNAAVVKLVRAGFKEKTIISIIDSRPPAYELSTERMIELKHDGVSEHIILAMLNRQQGMSAFDDSWNDEPFFKSKSDKTKDNQRSSGNQNQADIFGSSGSGQSNIRTRGGNLSQSGDTETTGSATVRIIRPPTENGGAGPTRLERTPALTNDSIIELVEAGFSEGTIVRRIEQSPIDFDLSPAQVAELRKHHVGDKVINAMKAAMGNDSNASKPGANSSGTPRP